MSASNARTTETQSPAKEGSKRAFALTGAVRDLETGEPVAGAEVSSSPLERAITDENGLYVLGGVVRPTSNSVDTIWVTAEGYVTEAVEVSVSSDNNIVRNFALEPGSEVLARVVDPEGGPIEGARIVMLLPGFRHNDYETDFETDASGEVLVGGVSRTNPRELLAKKDGYARGSRRTPRFDESGTPEVTFVLERFEREVGYYAGHVTNSSGDSLPDMEIRAAYVDPTNRGQEEHGKTDSDGHYLLAVENPKRDFHVVVGGRGYAPQSRAGILPGPKDAPSVLDFTLEPGHWLAGVVVGPDDVPLPDVEIQVNGIGERRGYLLFGESGFRKTDEEGRFRVEGAPAGKVRLLSHNAEGFSRVSKTFSVDQEVRIVLQPEGTLRGRVVERTTGKPVEDFVVKKILQKYQDDLFHRRGEAIHSRDGRFILKDLEYGKEYRVRVEAPHLLPTLVEKLVAVAEDEDEELLIEIDAGEPLSGRVIEAGTRSPMTDVSVVYAFVNENVVFYWGRIDDAGNLDMSDPQRTVTGNDGSFSLLEGERRGAILVRATGYVPVRIDPTERARYTSQGELVIPLKRGGSISGVFHVEGARKANARISTWNGSVGRGPVTTDAQGNYLLDGLPAGIHKVKASVHPHSMTREIQLHDGENKIANLGDDLGALSIGGRVLKTDLIGVFSSDDLSQFVAPARGAPDHGPRSSVAPRAGARNSTR